jgi:hypothetical protein
MKLKSWLGMGVIGATLAGVLGVASLSSATNCTGPIVAFTTLSTCDANGSAAADVQSFGITGPIRSIAVSKNDNSEPNATGDGLTSGGSVVCSATDTVQDSQGAWKSCPATAVNNRASFF